MLYYFYHNTYDESISKAQDQASSLFHIEVYKVADKYLVYSLTESALGKFEDSVIQHWRSDSFAETVAEV